MKTLALLLLLLPALAEAQTHTFKLNWTLGPTATDGSNAATGIRIERKQGTTGIYAQIAQLGLVTTYADPVGNPAPGGMVYCYRVRAFNAVGNSAYTNEACGTTAPVVVPVVPNAPEGFTVSALSQSVIELSWASVENADGYTWERRRGRQQWMVEKTGTALADATTVRDINLKRGATYCYDVAAQNGAGSSAPTQIACATTRR